MFASFYAGAVISAQALKIKSRLLEHHKENKLVKPLSDEEVKALTAFTASKSWASSKAIDLGFKSVALHGEAADVDVEAIADEINQLRAKMRTYHPDNIYNMDETGLMYKCLPNRSYVKKSEVKSVKAALLCMSAQMQLVQTSSHSASSGRRQHRTVLRTTFH